MKKLIAFIGADIQPEVNKWIDANVPGAGPTTFSAPHSATGKGKITHYATCWRADDSTKTKVTGHLEKTYKTKFSYDYIDQEDVQSKVSLKKLKPLDDLN